MMTDFRWNSGFRNKSSMIALALVMFCGAMIFAGKSMAAGAGGGENDIHLTITIDSALQGQAILVGLAILIGVYVLIITEVVHRTLAAAVGGFLAMMALNYYSDQDVLNIIAVASMIDWETIGLLLGMMVMVGVMSHTGIFEWFAIQAYKRSGGEVWTLVVILCVVTAILSAFLDNVTTMLLLTPVTIQLAKVLDLKPIPILIAEVLFSNIGGAATMIGDPPNIMIGAGLSPAAIKSKGYPELADSGVTFLQFITEMGPGILMCVVPSFMLIKWLYRDEFVGKRERDVTELEKKYGIKDPQGLKVSGAILGLVIVGFFTHPITHIAVSYIALGGAVIMLLATNRHELEEPLEHVEWTTLLFFAGLFVMVHSLQYIGVIDAIGERVISLISNFEDPTVQLAMAIVIVLWVSAIASAFIDNIPYTATMIPIVLQIADTTGLELEPIIWALAFGACLGGNGTLIGASANVVTAGMSEEAGYPISFNEFFKAGFPVMILTTFIVTIYMLIVYVMGQDGGQAMLKIILIGITVISIILALSRGKAKGQTIAESIGDSGIEDAVESVKEVVDKVTNKNEGNEE